MPLNVSRELNYDKDFLSSDVLLSRNESNSRNLTMLPEMLQNYFYM